MKINITCPGGHITRNTVQPEEEAPEAAATEVAAAGDASGKIFCRQVDAGEYTFFHGFFCMAEKSLVQIQADEPVLQILTVLGGEGQFTIEGIGNINLTEGQFSILYAPDAEVLMPFPMEAELLIAGIYFPLEFLLYYQQIFPLQAFIDEITANRAALLLQQPGGLTNFILEIISSLLHTPPRNDILHISLLELKMKELLLLAMHEEFFPDNGEIPEKDLEGVKKARRIMEVHVSEKLSVKQIALLADIDPANLKKYFKRVTGIELYAFIWQTRLDNAKLLLVETNLSIPEISAIAGYNHPMIFIRKFKEYTGITPVSFRKSQR